MRSIRSFLLVGTVAILILYNFVAALRGYQSSMLEAETLFDNQLLDLSQLIANLDVTRVTPDFHLGNNLTFQIWDNDTLLGASYQAPPEALNAFVAGFDFSDFDGYRWRTFTRLDEETGHWVIVAERTDLRYVLAENVVLESIAPILLGIPVAGLLIWLIVGVGMRPLQVLSADAAHELRTPISALKIQLHNLAQEVDTNSEAFGHLQQGVERIQHLVEQLLSLYRSSPDQFAANCTRLDLLAVTQDVVARLYPLIEQKQQTLELDGDGGYINGDRFALETLVANLVSNASRYTQAGGRIQLKLEKREGRVCLVVADNGAGIAETERERVFDRFYRSGTADDSGAHGCGLGLTIVQHVADLHHATVSVEASGLGSGTAFRVCFQESNHA